MSNNSFAIPSDAISINMFGGHTFENNMFTRDQWESFERLYSMDDIDHPLMRAAAQRDTGRLMLRDGARLMAVLARHLYPGDDPVKVLIRLMADADWDLSPDEIEYVDAEEEADE